MKMIFKHSERCPVSRRARNEVEDFLKTLDKPLEFEMVDVLNNRERARSVTVAYGIAHESPQVIILDENDQVVWHGSHWDISQASLQSAIAESRSRVGG